MTVQLLAELFAAGAWVDITGDVYERSPVRITRGRANESAAVSPSTCDLVLNNRAGKYSPRNPLSPFYGSIARNTPIRISYIHQGVTYRRFTGEVSAWPQRWDLSGADAWVTITAAGIMRRLGQGTAPLLSAPRRYIPATRPVAYWPMDAGPLASVGAPVVGIHAMQPMSAATKFGNGELAGWLDPAAAIESNATIVGPVRMPVATKHWAVDHLRRSPGGGTGPSTLHIVGNRDLGPVANRLSWSVTMTPNFNDVEVYLFFTGDTTSSASLLGTVVYSPLFTDDMHHLRFEVAETGANLDWAFLVDGVRVTGGTRTGLANQGVGQVRLSYNPAAGEEPMSFGHVAVWGDDSVPLVADAVNACGGYAGEPAGTRIERLCLENTIPLQPKGNLADTEPMGPQTLSTLMTLLGECADVDMGILHEPRDMLGLAYRTRSSMYDQVGVV